MPQKEQPLDRKSPDWVGIGVFTLIFAVMIWLSYDAYHKARAGRDLIEAITKKNFTEAKRIVHHDRLNPTDINNGLIAAVNQHTYVGTPQGQAELEIARLCLKLGADPEFTNVNDFSNQSAFLIAVRRHDAKILELLFEYHPVLSSNSVAYTYITEAIGVDNAEILKILIAHGALKVKLMDNGTEGLRLAVLRNSHKCVKALLDAGVKPNIQVNNDTALCVALSMRLWQSATELILHGANVTAPGAKGRTPLSIATKANNKEMIALLKTHGAK